MKISVIKTEKILPRSYQLHELLDKYVPDFKESSILVITSKIVSLCEGRVVNTDKVNRDELIESEADLYLAPASNKYGHHFSIIKNTLIGSAGIDTSNAAGNYVLWPTDPQKTANEVRRYLKQKFSLKNAGVIITDSISIPMRRGSVGTSIAHSGFEALHDYRGTNDLFGHEFHVSVANLAEGLAAAATVNMGEGTEQTPLAIIEEVPLVKFQDKDPTKDEVDNLRLGINEDLFGMFLESAPWQRGKSGTP